MATESQPDPGMQLKVPTGGLDASNLEHGQSYKRSWVLGISKCGESLDDFIICI